MGKVGVCKDCEDRYVGCHGECEKYIEFTLQQRQEKEKAWKERHKDIMYTKYMLEKSKRLMRNKK